MKGKKCKT